MTSTAKERRYKNKICPACCGEGGGEENEYTWWNCSTCKGTGKIPNPNWIGLEPK